MVTVNEVRKLAERLSKAEALVEAGAAFPVSGLPGNAVVRNGDGNSMYLVRFEAGREHCTCPDFQHRQGKAGQPCKHILAAELGASLEASITSQPTAVKRSGLLAWQDEDEADARAAWGEEPFPLNWPE
jgi:hypothetical protein